MSRLRRKEIKERAIEETQAVFEREDFKRHILEVSQRNNIPHDVVDAVVKHYLLTITKVMFMFKFIRKRITLYSHMNIEVKPNKILKKKS